MHDTMMEKKDLLGVRKRTPPPPPAAKRRRKIVAPVKASGGGGARRLAKAIAAYLASDSYMYAPLVSAPPPPPPPATAGVPSAAPPVSTPVKSEHSAGGLPFVVVIKDADHVEGCADAGYIDGSRLMPSTCYMGCDLSMVDSPNHSIAETHAHTWMGSRCFNKATQPLGAVSLRIVFTKG